MLNWKTVKFDWMRLNWFNSSLSPSSTEILSCTSIYELNSKFHKLCEEYSIQEFGLVNIHTTSSLQKNIDFFDTYPNQWRTHYKDKKYYLCDPVFSQYGTFHFPFSWSLDSLIQKNSSPQQKKFFSEAYDHQIQKGLTIPLKSRSLEQSFLTILNHNHIHYEVLSILSIAADIYYQQKKRLEDFELFKLLTKREKEVLYYKIQNLGLQEISSLLKISISTINFHIQKVCKKLNAVSLNHALFLYGKYEKDLNLSSDNLHQIV